MYPRGTPHAQYPKRRGDSIRISPHLPFPLAGLLMATPTVSSYVGSQPLNCWGQAAQAKIARACGFHIRHFLRTRSASNLGMNFQYIEGA